MEDGRGKEKNKEDVACATMAMLHSRLAHKYLLIIPDQGFPSSRFSSVLLQFTEAFDYYCVRRSLADSAMQGSRYFWVGAKRALGKSWSTAIRDGRF